MRKTLCYLTFLFAALSCSAKKEAAYLDKDGVPKPTTYYVNDFTGKMLDEDEIATLNARLKAYEDSTTTQVVVIIIPTLPDQWGDIADLAFETGDRWKIGQKDKDNGILLLILSEDRKMFIAPGYGAEGALTDALCTRIVEDDIVPYFKDEEYYDGISVGINKIELAMKGEYEAVAEVEMAKERQRIKFFTWMVGMIIMFSAVGAGVHPLLGTILQGIGASIAWKVIFGAIFAPFWIALIVVCIIVLVLSYMFRYGAEGGDGIGSFTGFGGGSGGSGGGGFSGGGGGFGGGGGGGGW